jgi:hypothetical protein
MIVLILVGALGACAATRYLADTRSWAAVLAGVLFGGPFFLQLWADSSQAAICGLGMILPFVVVGLEALRGRVADCVLLGLLAAGLLSLYPLFLPAVAVGVSIVLVVLLFRMTRYRPRTRPKISVAIGRLVLVVILAAALTPVAFLRDLRYWHAVLTGAQSFAGLPSYPLPIGVLPGWLLQSREFYYLPPLGVGGLKESVVAIVVPLIMLIVIVVGLRWRPRGMVLFSIVAAVPCWPSTSRRMTRARTVPRATSCP